MVGRFVEELVIAPFRCRSDWGVRCGGSCGCGWRGGPRVLGVRDGGQPHMRGAGYPKTLVSSHGPLSRIERGRRTARLLNGLSRTLVVRDAGRLGPPRRPLAGCGEGQSARAISQQKPASSRATATATTPLGLRRVCLSWRQRALRRR